MGKKLSEKEIKQLKIMSAIEDGMTLHVLIDTENVDSSSYIDLSLLRKGDILELMYTRNSKNISYDVLKKISECKAEILFSKFDVIDITKDLLDFKMVAKGTEIIVKSKRKFVIFVSQDKGFESAIDYLNDNFNNRSIRLDSLYNISENIKNVREKTITVENEYIS